MKSVHRLAVAVLILSAGSYASGQLAGLEGVDFASGRRIELGSYVGEVVYLDFWASWCAPCRESLPFMEELHQRYGEHGLRIVAVNVDENKADAKEFLKRHPISYLNLYDPKGKIGKQLKVRRMPTAFLVDRDGTILFRHVGFDKRYSEKLRLAIVALLDTERESAEARPRGVSRVRDAAGGAI